MDYSGKEIGMNANKVRKILIANGYQEVVSPILRFSNSKINPRFSVSTENSEIELYLRDCMEMSLRKYANRALPKVFEIGPCFRQDKIDDTHRQEFYMMELYSVGEGLAEMKTLTATIVSEVMGVNIPMKEVSLVNEILEDLKIDIRLASTEEVILAIRNKHSDLVGRKKYEVVNKYIEFLEKKICVDKEIVYFLEEYPVCTIDSAARYGNTNTIKRFETFFNGLEIAHAFVDCMDEIDIKKRAEESLILDRETLELVELIKQGQLLPTVGLGIGIDRLCMMQGGNCND